MITGDPKQRPAEALTMRTFADDDFIGGNDGFGSP
jgi:hypothetical protein